jgi:TonB family protein
MRRFLLLLVFGSIVSTSPAAEPGAIQLDDALRQNLLLTAPMPDYPFEMRRHRVEGSGIFELKFDYDTGHLRAVHVVKSTGAPMLDGYAVGALKLWKAKPHAVHTVLVPVAFTMSHRR